MTDYISRADAIEAVCDLYRVSSLFSGGSDRREDWYEKAEKLLSKCQSADAVQGEWEHLSIKSISRSGVDELQELQCSNCGKWVTTPYMYYPSYHKFCPNCGARMENK